MPENMMMYIWLVLLILFAIAEAATAQLTTIWFAAGALVSLILVICGVESVAVQVTVFILVSLIALIATRPLVKKFINKKTQPTNADRCIGEEAVVTEKIDNLTGHGFVSVKGVIWSARSNDDSIIDIGEKVRVLRIEGVKLIVEKL